MVKVQRRDEESARRIIELHLSTKVETHDDGTGDSMVDLLVGPVDAPDIAIEVTGAVDEPWAATWNASIKHSGTVSGVDGDWTFVVRAGANLKDLRQQLPPLIETIRATGLDTVHEEDLYLRPELRSQFERLGIAAAYLHGAPGSGKVHFTLDGQGGAVDSAGDSVADWISEFLAHPTRADNLRKLAATNAPQREVFIWAEVGGTPWSVMSYLTDIGRHAGQVPSGRPMLPAPVTGVWLTSTYYFGEPRGVRWDGTRWSSFRSRGEGIDDVVRTHDETQ